MSDQPPALSERVIARRGRIEYRKHVWGVAEFFPKSTTPHYLLTGFPYTSNVDTLT
jgi:hypothetical protein